MAYFDHNATTPLSPKAREVWLEASHRWWQNPSGLYREAAAAREQLEAAREQLAEMVAWEPERVIFTGGATEANHAFFAHLARIDAGSGRPSVLLSNREHPSVRESALRWCEATEFDPWHDHLESLDTRAIKAVALMAANNETGELLPTGETAEWCEEIGIPLWIDASQVFGKMLTASLLPQSAALVGCGHKFGGPKGVGFILLPNDGFPWRSQVGGPQEDRRRAGTEDVPGILAMVAALEEAESTLRHSPPCSDGRDAFESEILQRFPGTIIVAQDRERLWNTSMLMMPELDQRLWLARLSQRGFQVSTGSACSAGAADGSHTLESMGFSPDLRRRALRFSSGVKTTIEDWRNLAAAMGDVLQKNTS